MTRTQRRQILRRAGESMAIAVKHGWTLEYVVALLAIHEAFIAQREIERERTA